MAMFLGMISFLLALGLFAAALVLWHQGRPAGAGLVRVAGAVLGTGAVLTALCTVYFMFVYRVQGDFESAWPAMMSRPMMGERMGRMMREKGAGGMMGQERMQRGGMRAGEAAPEAEAPAHEEHHPEAE